MIEPMKVTKSLAIVTIFQLLTQKTQMTNHMMNQRENILDINQFEYYHEVIWVMEPINVQSIQ